MKKLLPFLFLLFGCSKPAFRYRMPDGSSTTSEDYFLSHTQNYEEQQILTIQYQQLCGLISESTADKRIDSVEFAINNWIGEQTQKNLDYWKGK